MLEILLLKWLLLSIIILNLFMKVSNLLSVSTPWGSFLSKFLPVGVGPASGVLQSIVRRLFTNFDDWTIVIFDNFLRGFLSGRSCTKSWVGRTGFKG